LLFIKYFFSKQNENLFFFFPVGDVIHLGVGRDPAGVVVLRCHDRASDQEGSAVLDKLQF